MRLKKEFFQREILEVAPDLLGQIIVRRFENGEQLRFVITETEAYRGEDDMACHASKGRTGRTEALYHAGGEIYIYLIYGMYWLLNIVADKPGFPAGILIRGLEDQEGIKVIGPGRVGRRLKIDKSFYSEDLDSSQRIWVESSGAFPVFENLPRVGVDYAGEWARKLWRYRVKEGVDECHKIESGGTRI